MQERLLTGLFLCSTEPNAILAQLKPEWNERVDLPLQNKLLITHYPLLINDVFPWKQELSESIEYEKFCESFFTQPDIFLRLRPGYEKIVKEKLMGAGLGFEEQNKTCVSLPAGSKTDNVIDLDKEAVVQDYNSQQTGEFLTLAIDKYQSPITAWDCCAASGGKSLLLYDLHPNIDLTVSDVRRSILINLEKRFKKAGLEKFKAVVTDLTRNKIPITRNFDLIICDAPCTGSGTWSRTPEQLYFFDENKIDHYAQLQKKIVSNVSSHLKEKGFLVYITCSVFKKENEEVAKFIEQESQLQLVKMTGFKGYDKKADTLFAALFQRS